MSNVFISHSSHDKPFVRRLATALLSEGFPVWLDSWKLEFGDSLLDEIYDGIENSGTILLVVSQDAVKSGWVNRELNAALAKEQQAGRKFLIPIKIDDCELPLKVADRFFADFSSSFTAPFTKLVDVLARQGFRELSVLPEREEVSLAFTREVNLDVIALRKACNFIRKRQGQIELRGDQIFINEDTECDKLLERLQARIDGVATDRFYSPELEMNLKAALSETLDDYRRLSEGVALMLSHDCRSDSIYWFSKIVRGRIVYRLWSMQSPDDVNILDYGRGWRNSGLSSSSDAITFFEVKSVEAVDAWASDNDSRSPYFHFWINREEIAGLYYREDSEDIYVGPVRFYVACDRFAGDKYAYPQMLLQHLMWPQERGPMIWDLDKVMVGLT